MQIDNVNHPSHYTQGGIECIEAIKASMTSDGFYTDCDQCLLHGVKEKLKDVLEEAET